MSENTTCPATVDGNNVNSYFVSFTDSQKDGISKKEARRTSLESQKVGGEFAEFLKTLSKLAALDVSKQVSACTKT